MAGWFGGECCVCKAVACLLLDSADWFKGSCEEDAPHLSLPKLCLVITTRERTSLPLRMLVHRFALLVCLVGDVTHVIVSEVTSAKVTGC